MATAMQERAAKDTLANIGRKRPKNKKEILRDAGYTPAMQKNPDLVFESKGFKELLEKELPDSSLTKLHKKFLNKKEVLIISDGAKEGSHYEFTGQPHTDALKALSEAYKLKNKYPEEPGGGNKTLIINITGETASRYGILKGE